MLNSAVPPKPRRGDKLFQVGEASSNARLGLHPGSEFPYRQGYWRGARRLAGHIREKGYEQDFLVYPIFYLYRHHVELVLKRLLRLIANVVDEEIDLKSSRLKTHRIDQLWDDCKRVLKTQSVSEQWTLELQSEDLEGLDWYIGQLAEKDPDSQAFRYAHNTKDEVSLPEDLKLFNIAIFADHMERLCCFLDGLDSYVDYGLEIRNETAAG